MVESRLLMTTPTTTLIVHPAKKPLTGSVPVPSDKSIGHRALLFASLCEGESRIFGFSHGEDNVSTADAMRAMGVRIEEPAPSELVVHGNGLFGLTAPTSALDCGNSGTTMRLLTGILAAQPFAATLVGDASLSRRPMLRVVGPLRSRGAVIAGRPRTPRRRTTSRRRSSSGRCPRPRTSRRSSTRASHRERAGQERCCCRASSRTGRRTCASLGSRAITPSA